jgi:hypothetical protein
VGDVAFAKTDAGKGNLRDYKYDLIPSNRRVTMTLAGSDEFQDEIQRVAAFSSPLAFIAKRTLEEERTDAPLAVRIFAESRMSGVVGYVPRGLEAVALENVSRLESRGENGRIPIKIDRTRQGLRVLLLMGLTR